MKRNIKKEGFKYGNVLGDASQVFRFDLYNRIGLKNLFKNKTILDIGCGYGIDSLNLLQYGKTVVGVDIDVHKSWKDISSKNLSFKKCNSEELPFKNGTFEGIFLKDLLHHVDSPANALREIKRVASKNANIVIIEGNRYNPLFFLYATKLKHHEHFSQSEFKKIVLELFPNTKFQHIECYPPFFLNPKWFQIVLRFEKMVEKITFLKPIFSYNVAVIKK